ncbi:hypothetical protein GUJ93_ZPchr0011g28620 [Zizania palustris]|uniref:MATH domain-containing protein n=1 Tax=Zizania palustris TaxID=103762 RepID=A0A8J5WJM4_ZIZPA|nr:hypothetical protein GUJ93_ZPchr0011g28620 [Zizania palustris]
MPTTTMVSPQSVSSIAVSATEGSHLLKISGYSQTKLLGNGERLTSAKFKAAGHTWRILFYPNGYQSMDTGAVSVYLHLADWSKDVCAEVRFSLLRRRAGADDDGTPLKYSNNRPVLRHTFASSRRRRCSRTDDCGFGRFIYVNDLDSPEFYVGDVGDEDCIFLRCDIKVLNKPAVQGHVLQDSERPICSCKDDTCKRFHGSLEKPWPAAARRRPWLKEVFIKCLPF